MKFLCPWIRATIGCFTVPCIPYLQWFLFSFSVFGYLVVNFYFNNMHIKHGILFEKFSLKLCMPCWSCSNNLTFILFEIYLPCALFIFVPQNFYMIGRDKSRAHWRVLKIDRLDPSELNVREDSTTYSERECSDLLRRIHEGNKSTGGLKFVTTCYGIVGMYVHSVLFSCMLISYQSLS